MTIHYHIFNLELKHTFRISRSANDFQRTLIIELRHNGYHGYGEATENPYYHVTIEGMVDQLNEVKTIIESAQFEDLPSWLDLVHRLFHDQSFLLCALDLALHDCFARIAEVPLYQYWNLSTDHLPMTNYTIGIDSIEKMVEKLKMKPWPLYKIKLGTEQDLEIIQALREQTAAVFRIDANCGWTPEYTIEIAPKLKDLGVEFIEQPLPAADWEGMKYVFKHSVLPVIADESCQVASDVAKCIGHFHGINIKLVKCGGFRPALQMIKEARLNGLKLMVGCMTESSVGISAIAQLLPLLDYVDMDGALLLKKDIAKGVEIRAGKVFLNRSPGTGVELIKD